jgi:hypothetical protein
MIINWPNWHVLGAEVNSVHFWRLGCMHQSAVAMQHVSAHFENFLRERSNLFFNPLHHACKIFDRGEE